MNTKTRNALAIAAQAIIFVTTVFALIGFFTVGGEGNMQVAGWRAFRYFTVDSNVLAAIAGLICIPYEVRAIRTGEDALPHWALILYFAGAVAVTITFTVVIAFLGFVYGYALMFTGSSLYLHGVNPILAILVFMFLLKGPVRLKECLWCILPVFVYGVVYMVMVVAIGEAAGGWPDFYAFNVTGMWYIAFIVIGVLSFILAAIERLPHRAH